MIFNGVDIYAAMGDKKHYAKPMLKVGDKIRFLYDDETTKPDSRTVMIKKGVYNITYVGAGVAGPIYDFVKDAKNSKYVHHYCQIVIDKAIQSTLIEIV